MPEELATEIRDALIENDEGDETQTVSTYDDHMSALFRVLEENGELETVVRNAQEHLNREDEDVTRSNAVKLLLRVGLEASSPEVIDEAREGYREYLVTQSEEF